MAHVFKGEQWNYIQPPHQLRTTDLKQINQIKSNDLIW